VNPVTL